MASAQDQRDVSSLRVENLVGSTPESLEQDVTFQNINLSENNHDEDSNDSLNITSIESIPNSFCFRFRNALSSYCMQAYQILIRTYLFCFYDYSNFTRDGLWRG